MYTCMFVFFLLAGSRKWFWIFWEYYKFLGEKSAGHIYCFFSVFVVNCDISRLCIDDLVEI